MRYRKKGLVGKLLKVSSTLVPIPGKIIRLVKLLEARPVDEKKTLKVRHGGT